MQRRLLYYLLALASFAIASPAFAQAVGGGIATDPVTFIQNVARAGLLGAGAIAVMGGGFKAVQVWSGQRNMYEAATWLLGGMSLIFGTAAVVGFQ